MRKLEGKAVVITGAASGIGRALAVAMAAQGARLLLADIDEPGLQSLCAELEAQGCDCGWRRTDTGIEADIHALAADAAARFGAIDVLINNAGVALMVPVDQLQTADAQWLMNINFWGVVHGCRAFLPQMRTRPDAVIVNISSIFAMLSMPTQGMYNAAKAAVRAFSDALREELRGTPVRVLCVHPGGIKTHIANNARIINASMVADTPEALRSNFTALAPTTPEQAAALLVRAIQTGRERLLIGPDAQVMDLLWRLFPTRAAGWMMRLSQWLRHRSRQKTI